MLKLMLKASVLSLMALPLSAQSGLSTADKETLRNEIREYILENPEILREAMAILEEREADAQRLADIALVQLHSDSLYSDGFSFIGGNPDGDITIVEFVDYQCGYCKRAHPEVQAILSADPNIRYVAKELPILGPASMVAARSALAVLDQQGPEVYAKFSDALMRHQAQLTPSVISSLAEASGVDTQKMLTLADTDTITNRLNANRALAQAIKLSGTPTFVVGDKILRGYLPLPEMQRVIEEERDGA